MSPPPINIRNSSRSTTCVCFGQKLNVRQSQASVWKLRPKQRKKVVVSPGGEPVRVAATTPKVRMCTGLEVLPNHLGHVRTNVSSTHVRAGYCHRFSVFQKFVMMSFFAYRRLFDYFFVFLLCREPNLWV